MKDVLTHCTLILQVSNSCTGICNQDLNPLTAKLFNLNFHRLEVVSRSRDPQLQMSDNYSDLTKWSSIFSNLADLMLNFISSMFKMRYLQCNVEIKKLKTEYIQDRCLKG